MYKKVLIYSAALFLLIPGGCSGPPTQLINRALASTNVIFQTDAQLPIILSEPQGQTLKRIVQRFNKPSVVRSQTEMLPTDTGQFILGDVNFGWLGGSLNIHDPKAKRYYVVEDPILLHMAEKYFKLEGEPPVKALSREQWLEILSLLANGNQ